MRPTHVFTGYVGQGYPASAQAGQMSHMAPRTSGSAIPARTHGRASANEPDGLFPDVPEARKRKFILVDDNMRGSRLRVRVTLDGVDTNEIPDSFRKGASVFPRSYFPREMQSPPPSASGAQFFVQDECDDDKIQETEGRDSGARRARKSASEAVQMSLAEGGSGGVLVPRMKRSCRSKEVKLNDMAYRMAWLQSRVFAGRTVFLQRALDTYRNKTKAAIEGTMQDVVAVAPHYETRAGKRKWNDRRSRGEATNQD